MKMPRDVSRVVQVAHGAEGNDHEAVVVVVAALHLALINADHFKAQAIDADRLPQRRLAGEEPASGFVADHRHARALQLIFFAQASPGRDRKSANALVNGIDSGQKQIGEGARVVLNGDAIAFVEDRSDALDHRHFVADVIDVGKLKADFAARLRASGLQRRASGKCADHISAPRS